MEDLNENKIEFKPIEHTRTSDCCAECEHGNKKWCDEPCYRCGEVNNYFHFEQKSELL